jgi:hypothetical protein
MQLQVRVSSYSHVALCNSNNNLNSSSGQSAGLGVQVGIRPHVHLRPRQRRGFRRACSDDDALSPANVGRLADWPGAAQQRRKSDLHRVAAFIFVVLSGGRGGVRFETGQ